MPVISNLIVIHLTFFLKMLERIQNEIQEISFYGSNRNQANRLGLALGARVGQDA